MREDLVIPFCSVIDAELGEDVRLSPFVNLWGCRIGAGTRVGAFTEIGRGVTIGRNCKIGAYVFIPPGITIEDDVFIGPQVGFCNDRYPRAVGEWTCLHTTVKRGASIGLGAVILPGLTIGEGAMVGAGAVVTSNVRANTVLVTGRNREVWPAREGSGL